LASEHPFQNIFNITLYSTFFHMNNRFSIDSLYPQQWANMCKPIFFLKISCCIICDHPKNDLALNGNMFLELVPKNRNLVETSPPPPTPQSKANVMKNFQKNFFGKFPPKKEEYVTIYSIFIFISTFVWNSAQKKLFVKTCSLWCLCSFCHQLGFHVVCKICHWSHINIFLLHTILMKGVIPLEIACGQEKAMKIVSLQLWKWLLATWPFCFTWKVWEKTMIKLFQSRCARWFFFVHLACTH